MRAFASLVLPVAFVSGISTWVLLAPAREAAAAPARLVPAEPRSDRERTTMDGVYTTAQATKGADLFAGYCRSCHTVETHASPAFRSKWLGRSLGELFGYMRREMPKNEPGSMSDDEYALALAYVLQANRMPAGSEPLAADSAALHSIRFDSVRTASSNPPR